MGKKPIKVSRPWIKEKVAFERDNSNQEIYNSWKWRKFSKQHKLLNPLCVQCDKDGLVTVGTVADHIVPINKGGTVFEKENIQTLCESCHNRKSASERGMG